MTDTTQNVQQSSVGGRNGGWYGVFAELSRYKHLFQKILSHFLAI